MTTTFCEPPFFYAQLENAMSCPDCGSRPRLYEMRRPVDSLRDKCSIELSHCERRSRIEFDPMSKSPEAAMKELIRHWNDTNMALVP